MRLSQHYGLPIEEITDTRRDYPLRVDQPRTEAIDAELHRLAGLLQKLPKAVAAGRLPDTDYIPAGGSQEMMGTFPQGRFTEAPIMMVQWYASQWGFLTVKSVSASGYRVVYIAPPDRSVLGRGVYIAVQF